MIRIVDNEVQDHKHSPLPYPKTFLQFADSNIVSAGGILYIFSINSLLWPSLIS